MNAVREPVLSRSLVNISLRYLQRHPLQTGLTLLGVMLGVAIVVAVDLANASAARALALSLEMTSGNASHQILGGPEGIPEDLYRRLRTELGLVQSAPLVSDEVRIIEKGAKEQRLTLIGLDVFAHNFARPLQQPEITAAEARRLLLEANTVGLSRRTAELLNVQAGDRVQLTHRGSTREVEVVHVYASGHPGSDGLLVADIATAQELLGRVGVLDRIDLSLPDAAAVDSLRRWLPPGLRLVPADEQRQTRQQMSHAFHLNLSAMSLLALLVGGFLIFNTMTVAVLRRREQFGSLRSLGVSRRELFALVLLEAALLGGFATLAGLAAGIVLGQFLIELVTTTINDLYYRQHVSQLLVSPLSLLRGLLLGLVTTGIAAWLPARDAARTPPVTLLQRSATEQKSSRLFTGLALAGLVLALAGWFLTGVASHSLPLGFTALGLVIVGICLVVPLLTRLLCTLANLAASRTPLLARLAIRGIDSSLSRTGPAIAALALALATTLGVGIMITSFRQTVVDWLDQSLEADVYLSIPGGMSDRSDRGLPPELVRDLRNLPEVASSRASRMLKVDSNLGKVRLMAVETDPAHQRQLHLKEGEPQHVQKTFEAGDGVLISEPLAWHQRLQVGDSIRLHTPGGAVNQQILGIFYDYTSGSGMVLLPLQRYRQLWREPGISSVGLYARPGVDASLLATAVRDLADSYDPALQVRSSADIRSISLAIFDRTFTVTEVLRLLSILVAFVGVLTALLTLQLEKTREYALLRATGVTPAQIRGLVLGQTLAIGLIAGLLALPLGFWMAILLIDVINLRSFGWSLQTVVPASALLQAVVVAVSAALLAGIYPAFRAGRLGVATAMQGE